MRLIGHIQKFRARLPWNKGIFIGGYNAGIEVLNMERVRFFDVGVKIACDVNKNRKKLLFYRNRLIHGLQNNTGDDV